VLTNRAAEFYVDGTKIPDVGWDAGASYAGLLPVSNKTGEARKLYFWFFPPGPQGSTKDLIMCVPIDVVRHEHKLTISPVG
jgi:carboxypeptidase D